MRCSTISMYQQSMNSVSRSMANANHTRNQLAEGRTLLKPSDNPVNASQALLSQHALAGIEQYKVARMHARDTLGYEENALNSIGGVLTKNLAEKIVAAGNGTYSTDSKHAVATELAAIRESLIDLANSKNGHGRYIFSGYKTAIQPFSSAGQYLGGQQAISQWVSESTEMQVSHLGSDIFISEEHGNLFTRLDETIAALRGEYAEDDLSPILKKTNQSIKQSLSNLGRVQANVGTNLQMLERLEFNSGDDFVLEETGYQNSIGSGSESIIRLMGDVAITEQALQSSMLLFSSMKNISLFNII